MKKQLLLLICVLILVSALVLSPVAADGATNITANPNEVYVLDVYPEYTSTLPLTAAHSTNVSLVNVTMSTNSLEGWHIKVSDTDPQKPASYLGRMTEYNTTSQTYVTNPRVLGQNLTVLGYGNYSTFAQQGYLGFTNASTITMGPTGIPVATGDVGNTGNGAGVFDNITVNVGQFVSFRDAALVGDHKYVIAVTFTGSLN
jgi:hypothetical protein